MPTLLSNLELSTETNCKATEFNDTLINAEKPGISCGGNPPLSCQAALQLAGNMKQIKQRAIVVSSLWSMPIDSKAVKFNVHQINKPKRRT